MRKKKKEKLVHFDIETLSKQTRKKAVLQPTTLGQTLQFKREKKKLSLQDVSNKLCIKEIYLRALESGHYDAFPNRVYGIGFLRSYAKFLGLDSDALVVQFNQETADIKEEPMDMLVIEKHRQLPSRKTLGALFILVCCLIVVWAIVSEILDPNAFSKVALPEGIIPDSAPVDVTEEVPAIADEVKPAETAVAEPVKNEIKEVAAEVFDSKVAFVATKDVWMELTNTETGKKILSKAMVKNEHFIPSSDLAVLTISTGRPGVVLYQNGKKTKSFGTEKNLSLADLASRD